MSALLVEGTPCDAGKSSVTTGPCRASARVGVKVAPVKAHNMSHNSMVRPDGLAVDGAPADLPVPAPGADR